MALLGEKRCIIAKAQPASIVERPSYAEGKIEVRLDPPQGKSVVVWARADAVSECR